MERTFKQEIADFCHAHSLSGRKFGELAFGDPAFWFKIDRGRDPKISTVAKARAFMDDYKPERAA